MGFERISLNELQPGDALLEFGGRIYFVEAMQPDGQFSVRTVVWPFDDQKWTAYRPIGPQGRLPARSDAPEGRVSEDIAAPDGGAQ